jgi:CheY-like chemotaxis protein
MTEGVLQREAIRAFRHEICTPLNHVLGYAEMLLEVVEEQGPPAPLPGLRNIVAAARQALACITGTLAPDRQQVARAELQAMGRAIEEHLEPLEAEVAALERQAPDLPPECVGDLQNLRSAAETLRRLAVELTDPGTASESARVVEHLLERDAVEGRSEGRREQGRVLVVDNNEGNRELFRRRLEHEGHTVGVAEDGFRALEMLRAGDFDLVLLDVLMPGLDGYQVLEQIKADPRLRDVPVIMVSALDEIESVVRCIERGAEDYLPKPFEPVLLRARIGACLEKKRLREKELDYLRNVALVEAGAAALERGAFESASLAPVTRRGDELGRLARVFQKMAHEVQAREQRWRQQVHQLQIEIDEARKSQEVAKITETEYFQMLQSKAQSLKRRKESAG